MIEQLIDLFDAAVTAPVVTKHGLAILGPDGPMKRTQTGQYTPIAVDNEAPWSYWRIGDIKSTPYDIYACSMGALQQVPLRLVLLLPNDCGQRDILLAAGRSVTATTGAAKELLGAARVRVVGQRIAVDGVSQTEKITNVPLQWSLIAIDMDLEVIGTADCLVGCGEGPSVLCSVITTSTNAEVVECLGDRINEICGSGPCDPGYVQLYDDDSPTPNPIGSPVAIPAGTTVTVTAPHGTVKTTDGVTPVMEILSGGVANLPQTIFKYKDAFDVQQDSGSFGTLYTAPYMRGDFIFPRAGLKDSNNDEIGLYATLMDIALDTVPDIPDSTVNIQRKDSAGTNIGAVIPVSVKATATLAQNVTAPDGSVQPKDSAGTNIGSAVAVKSNGTANAPIADSAVTVNGASFASVKATQGLNVPVKDDAGTAVGAKVGSEWIVKRDPLKVVFGAGDAVSLLFTATVKEAGSYNAGSIGTGTLQVSINGGAFASGAFSLSIGQTFQAKRSAFATQDTATWARS